MLKKIYTNQAPDPVGSYSQAIEYKDLIFLSGQLALDPKSSHLIGDSAAEQTEQIFNNIEAVLQAAGSNLDQVIKCTIFLTAIDDFGAVDAIYQKRFNQHKPARSTIEVSRLPKAGLVEIEAIAIKSNR